MTGLEMRLRELDLSQIAVQRAGFIAIISANFWLVKEESIPNGLKILTSDEPNTASIQRESFCLFLFGLHQ